MIRAALLALLLATPAVAQPTPNPPAKPIVPSAAQLLADVEANYKKPQHLTAKFDQTVFNPTMGITQPATGLFRIEKPNKLRFDFYQPKRKDPKVNSIQLFDGKTLWIVDHKNTQWAQVATKDSPLPSLVTFFLGAGTLSRDFNVAAATDPKLVPAGASGLELTPKKPSASYSKIVLVIDAKRMVTQAAVTNSSGVVQTMTFTSVELDKPAPAGTFVFDRKWVDGYRLEKP